MIRPILLLCTALLAAAQTEPVYRTGTRLVEVDVVVRNEKGPVRGLTKDDFTVQDKGKNQTISVFAEQDSTAPTPDAKPLPPGVVSNRLNANGEPTRGALVILFDRLNMPQPEGGSSSAQVNARKQLLELLSTLKGTEKIGLYALYDKLTVVQDLDEPSARLVQGAKDLLEPSAAASASPEQQAFDARLNSALSASADMVNSVRAEITASITQDIARRIAGVPGRKALIWIASDFPFTYGTSKLRQEDSQSEVNNVGNLFSAANIAAYTIDPRGAGSAFKAAASNDNSDAEPGRLMRSHGQTNASDSQSDDSSLSGTQAMEEIANQTGGKAYINVNDIGAPIREILAGSEVSYTLGFYVPDKSLDGKKHNLEVKVAKKSETSGAKAYYRKSYIATAKPAHPEMKELVMDPLETAGVGVMAVAFKDPNKPGADVIQIRVDAQDLQFDHIADKWNAAFDLGLALDTGAGVPQLAVIPEKLSLTEDQLKKGLTGGLEIDQTVPPPDKNATLHVIVEDHNSGASGSVRVPLPGK